MKVIVNETMGNDVNLNLPSGLFMNPVTAAVLAKVLKKHGVELPRKQISEFMKLAQDYKKTHPEWKLVEVDSPSGEHVEIIL